MNERQQWPFHTTICMAFRLDVTSCCLQNHHNSRQWRPIVASSTLEIIGEAVAKMLLLEHAEATKNMPICVYLTPVSERKLTKIVSELTGINFQENRTSIETVTKEALKAVENGDWSKMGDFYVAFCFGAGYGRDFMYMASNHMLGLLEMSNAELKEMIEGWLKEMEVNKE